MNYVARFALSSLVAIAAGCGTVSSQPDASAAIDAAIDIDAAVAIDAAVDIDATIDAPSPATLQVAVGGNGNGTVTSAPAGINCGSDCSEAYASGTTVVLSAISSGGATFVGWSGGGCSGTGTCQLTLTADVTVTASFALNNSLVVVLAGNGLGTVTSSPAGIACGSDCSEAYPPATTVTLTATPVTGSTFTGWSGACAGVGVCMVSVTAPTAVTATFTLNQYTLTVSRGGNGTGTVTSSPAGINCGGDCTEVYGHGTAVVLTATPAIGSTFAGWSGACSGLGTCSISMTAASSTTATFTLTRYTLTVVRAGTGTGTVTSSPIGISCGVDCTEIYDYGTNVTLTAAPAAGSTFTGWSGACAGAGTCNLTVTAAATATATFTTAGCTTQTVDIFGAQHVSLNYLDTNSWRDDYFRAYDQPGYDLTGWVGFDLTSIPDTATISAMTLYAYAFTVVSAPTVRVQYSTGNNWSSATVVTAGLPRTNPQVANPIAPTVNAYNAFSIIVSSQNWTLDLQDNWLSLGVDNTSSAPSGSYGYFWGVTNALRPYVQITYCN